MILLERVSGLQNLTEVIMGVEESKINSNQIKSNTILARGEKDSGDQNTQD